MVRLDSCIWEPAIRIFEASLLRDRRGRGVLHRESSLSIFLDRLFNTWGTGKEETGDSLCVTILSF